MNKTILIIVCLTLASLIGNAQHKNNPHVVIDRIPKIAMPTLIDLDFCQKLHALNIPDSLVFFDEGRPAFFQIWISISFDKNGHVFSLNADGNSPLISNLLNEMELLLKSTRWNVKKVKTNKAFEIGCRLAIHGFEQLYFRTPDNTHRRKICN
ncbi:MAG: hypothetical protein JWQ27_2990 [Ferruginibacter sp.]|nr:hypothetical protein [Ferruginibacter sp.]